MLQLALPISAAAQQVDLDAAARTITEADYVRDRRIAHDSMQGRDTPSPGLDKTAAWIASEFRRFGLRGGASDGSFTQRYPLLSIAVDRIGPGSGAGPVASSSGGTSRR